MLENLITLTFIVWLLFSLKVTVFFIISRFYKAKKSSKKAKNVNFVVVTIASNKVKEALEETLENLKKFNVKTYVVVDEGAELINWLKEKDINLVVVPKNYKCDAIAKGRAINYFIENYVKENEWYVFFDDDSYPLDDKFLYEIPYYENLGYVCANCILYPRRGKNVFTYVLDSFRYLDDITIFRSFQGTLKKPVIGFHGEGLIVKGKVLKEIGFNFRSITEDFRFAQEIVKKGYKSWHSDTKVSILSPNSFKDFLMQRARWFKGILIDLRYASIHYLITLPFTIILWSMSFFGSVIFFILSFFDFYKVPFFITFPFGFAYMIYGIFIFPSAKVHEKLIAMFVGILETLAPVFAIKIKGFYVIDKNTKKSYGS
jgi:cellulose synthase/poly-beta-1,6-N-acetylglucosamine synthase-like glycosyltransferase